MSPVSAVAPPADPTALAPVVESLRGLFADATAQRTFSLALEQLAAHKIPSLAGIRTFEQCLVFLDELVRWAPRESGDSRMVHDKLVEFHFIFNQPALRPLQDAGPITSGKPGASAVPKMSPLSQWIVDFARAWGSYLDTPASAAAIDSFRTNPAFRWHDYMPPPSGYQTFNQFFARHVKPGYRPVAAIEDPRIIVSPCDAGFLGVWPIGTDSCIDVKGLRWSIAQLLDGSPYASRFADGVFTHSGLRTYDYHRWHAPVAGQVREARVVHGRAFLDVEVQPQPDGQGRLEAVEGTGYQFSQTRGLLVLESAIGLVACLPVGMAQVSSVVLTAETGRHLRKGEEMGYFQFGGSDFVMLFERAADVRFHCGEQEQLMQGVAMGSAIVHDQRATG